MDAEGRGRGGRHQRALRTQWVGRYRCDGESGLHDRSSAPKRVANHTSQERVYTHVLLDDRELDYRALLAVSA